MDIQLIGALDYKKLQTFLKEKKVENQEEIIQYIKDLEKFGRVQKVVSSGRISRFAGNVFDILNITAENTLEENIAFAERVIHLGHTSITDHDYLFFAIKDVSPVVEQTIIAERFSSFTIKSRRLVDFSHVGFYTPDFHDQQGKLLQNNEEVKRIYQNYMNTLFEQYNKLVSLGIPIEDARFVLPYSYHSNIFMGVDAHTLMEMIIKYTKTHLSKIQEIRVFGEKLLAIAQENCPYILKEIEKQSSKETDEIDDMFKDLAIPSYSVLDRVKLLNYSKEVDETILVSAIMRRYQTTREIALQILQQGISKNPTFKEDLMKKIVFEGDQLELTQVNFQYQIPISFAILTHLTRHRTQDILIPSFAPNIDLAQYKIPPTIKKNDLILDFYTEIYKKNREMYTYFKYELGIREEDLVYFTLSGNMVNVLTNMDGKTLEHILKLRECNRAQWETNEMAHAMHKELNQLKDAQIFSSLLGASCDTLGKCLEGKQSCGKLLQLKKKTAR